jgi:GT2 family glycosyltransferase
VSKPLFVIPQFLGQDSDLEVTLDAVRSVRKTVSDSVDVLVVDDCSPRQDLVDGIEPGLNRLEAELVRKPENTGFSKTVNVGLAKALREGRDAVLMNADVEMVTPGWVRICRKTKDDLGAPAGVVGALLLYPNGLIQHGGIYFSLLTRAFDHMFRYAPHNLPDAHREKVCPVTGAFQYIRAETLERVGLYDENFSMAHEDVDYCVRVFLGQRKCVFQPKVRAYHHEMLFRGRPSPKVEEWQRKSWIYFATKWDGQNFNGMVPFV